MIGTREWRRRLGFRSQSRLNADYAQNLALSGWTFGITGLVKVEGVPTAGIVVNLNVRSTGAFVQQVTTDANGVYLFTGLTQGTVYTAVFLDPDAAPDYNAQVLDKLTPAWLYAPGSDPYYSSVVLLAINNSAANGTTTFVDQSSYARTLTTIASAQYSTAQFPNGLTSSGLFASATNDGVSFASSVDFALGTGDYTMEVWGRYNGTGGTKVLLDLRSVDTSAPLIYSSGGNLFGLWLAANKITGTIPPDLTWAHIAMCRISGNTRLFGGGVQTGSTVADATSYVTTGGRFGISVGAPLNPFNGNLAAVRITKGIGRYLTNFTPPSLPFPVHA